MSASKPKTSQADRDQQIPGIWFRILTPSCHWEDKEEFLDVIYWGRQIAAILMGIMWGYLGLKGFFGIAAFIVVNSFIVFLYSTYFNDETEDDMMEFVKEGFMTAFASFMVAWILTFSAVFHPHLFAQSILFKENVSPAFRTPALPPPVIVVLFHETLRVSYTDTLADTATNGGAGSQSSATLQQDRVILTLDHCLLPAEKLEATPSQAHGLGREDETDLRILGCELIQSSGILLRLPQVAMATGQVLFQRFYYTESFVRQSMEMTSMACIALASKIEEAPRRLRDVINVFNHLKQRRTGQTPSPMLLDHQYITIKNQVIKAERRLLKVLGFCVHIKHPHKFVVSLLQVLGLTADRELVQTSWNYMNDSLRTDVFCRHTADTIAVSCIYLSTRVLRVALPAKPCWLEIMGIKETDVRDVCRRILSIYARPKPDQLKLEQVIRSLKADLDQQKSTQSQN